MERHETGRTIRKPRGSRPLVLKYMGVKKVEFRMNVGVCRGLVVVWCCQSVAWIITRPFEVGIHRANAIEAACWQKPDRTSTGAFQPKT